MKLLKTISLILAAMLPLTGRAEDQRPNILYIQMEDMGCQIGVYGDHTAHTPNLDKLAGQGVAFNRVNVTAATCAASRGSQLTGLYPHLNGIMGFVKEHGFHLREGLRTYVTMLKEAGYYTGITYKNGLDTNEVTPWDLNADWRRNMITPEDNQNEVKNSIANFKYFLETRPKGRPFYFQSQNSNTHTPWVGKKVDDHFSVKGMPGAEAYPPIDPNSVNPLPHFGEGFVMTPQVRDWMSGYYEAIQRVDYFVGSILALLEEYGEGENTIVIFTADHGPSELTRGKTTPYEFGLRVPFIVRWPGEGQKNIHSDALVSFVDLAPTFLDLAGIERPGYLAGHSILPAITGAAPKGSRKYLYSAYIAHTTGIYWPTRTINDGRFKLIHHLLGDGSTPVSTYHQQRNFRESNGYKGPVAAAIRKLEPASVARVAFERGFTPPEFELYDLENDPGEISNLINVPECAEIESRLRTELVKWQKDIVQDPFLNPDFLEAFTADYAAKVRFYAENKEEEPLKAGFSRLNKWGGWKLDFEGWIPPWNPEGYGQDPSL